MVTGNRPLVTFGTAALVFAGAVAVPTAVPTVGRREASPANHRARGFLDLLQTRRAARRWPS
jgi:hypothetical protein